MCVVGACYECDIVCAVDDAAILVSIVVSIPACHAGDPGSIPGREDFALCFLLFALRLFLFAVCLVAFGLCCMRFADATSSRASYRNKVSV